MKCLILFAQLEIYKFEEYFSEGIMLRTRVYLTHQASFFILRFLFRPLLKKAVFVLYLLVSSWIEYQGQSDLDDLNIFTDGNNDILKYIILSQTNSNGYKFMIPTYCTI